MERFAELRLLSTIDIHWKFDIGEIEISEVVFVNSAEEAEGFAEDVFVAWPTERSDMLLELINGWLDPERTGLFQRADRVIDIDDLNVELPLTQQLLVEDWETMTEIRSRFGIEENRSSSNILILRDIVKREIREPTRSEEETTED